MGQNKRKAEQLGMSHGTATARLRKALLFQLLQETNKDICYRCGERIKHVDELSVDHKIPWLNSDDPVGLFFELDNVAFSHLSCNCSCATRPKREVVVLTCAFCGNKFKRYSRNVNSKMKNGQTDFYCDKSCAGKHFGNHRPKKRG